MNDLGRTQRARGSAGGGRSARRRSRRRLGAHQPQGEHGWTVLEDTNGNEVGYGRFTEDANGAVTLPWTPDQTCWG